MAEIPMRSFKFPGLDHEYSIPSAPEHIGAAPAGYGLGSVAGADKWNGDANALTKQGWYRLESGTTNGVGESASVRVDGYAETGLTQTAYCNSGLIKQRTCVDGVWSEWVRCDPSAFALALQYHAANLTAVGWYKVGTIQTTNHTAHATVYTGGIYSTKSPTSGIVDISFSYYRANAKTRLQCNVGHQIMRVGIVQESEKVYGVYVYYNSGTRNVVQINVETVEATFTPTDFEAVSIAESEMMTVAYLDEYDNPPMIPGTEYRTTERFNGRPVYAQLKQIGAFSGKATTTIGNGWNALARIHGIIQYEGGYLIPLRDSAISCKTAATGYTYVEIDIGSNVCKDCWVCGWYYT